MILLWTISRLQIAIWMGQSTNVREGNNYKTHYSTQLTSKLSRMGCLLSWSWYGYAIQLGQLERLRFCLSKFCIPGLGEFLACEESLSPSKEGGSPSNVSESESESVVAGALSDPLECFTDAWNIIKRCLTRPFRRDCDSCWPLWSKVNWCFTSL